jgi:hypothetical protein
MISWLVTQIRQGLIMSNISSGPARPASSHVPGAIIALLLSLLSLLPPTAAGEARADAARPAAPQGPEIIISSCRRKTPGDRLRIHRCLLGEYERLEKEVDRLNDRLLGLIGSHRSFGRLKIIQWSNAVAKSHYYWQKLTPWDCEWEGHALPSSKGAAVAMDICGVKRAAARIRLLQARIDAVKKIIDGSGHGAGGNGG